MSPIWAIKKFDRGKIRNHIRLTSNNKLNDINKGHVALKEVKPLHEVPLWFPDEIDFHSEGEDVVPNEHHTCHDCPECQDSTIDSLITDLTLKILPGGDQIGEMQQLRRRTATSLITNNARIKEANWFPGSSMSVYYPRGSACLEVSREEGMKLGE